MPELPNLPEPTHEELLCEAQQRLAEHFGGRWASAAAMHEAEPVRVARIPQAVIAEQVAGITTRETIPITI